MNKKSIIFLLFFFFCAGFITHALFFPTILTQNFLLYTKKSLKNENISVPVVKNTNPALTLISFEEGEFDPQVAVVGKSYYLAITNKSKKEPMMLTSANALLRTARPYGESEQLLVQLYEEGEYTVSSVLHPERTLKVIVK